MINKQSTHFMTVRNIHIYSYTTLNVHVLLPSHLLGGLHERFGLALVDLQALREQPRAVDDRLRGECLQRVGAVQRLLVISLLHLDCIQRRLANKDV